MEADPEPLQKLCVRLARCGPETVSPGGPGSLSVLESPMCCRWVPVLMVA